MVNVTLAGLAGIIVTIVVAGLLATYGGQINSSVQDDFIADDEGVGCAEDNNNCTSVGYNLTSNTQLGLLNLTGQLPSVGTVIGAALIIGVLVGAFVFFGRGNGGGISFK